jgi:translocation and assembly module TamB
LPSATAKKSRMLWALLALLLLLLAIGTWWLRRDDGWLWLLKRAPGVSVTSAQGALAGGPATLKGFTWKDDRWEVAIDELQWRDVRWHVRWPWRLQSHAWLDVEIDGLDVGKVQIRSPKTPSSNPPPETLRLPLQVNLLGFRVASVQLDAHPPVQDMAGSAMLGDAQGSVHRVDNLTFKWQRLMGKANGTIRTDAPLQVQAKVQAQTMAKDAANTSNVALWQGQLDATGPLAQLGIKLDAANAAAGRFEGQTTLQPFKPWPVAELNAKLNDVDLNAFISTWPNTKLLGNVQTLVPSKTQPLQILADLSNHGAGRLDQQRIPVKQLSIGLASSLAEPDTVQVQRLSMDLVEGAGRVSGRGRWQGTSASLVLDTHGLRPALLDQRWPKLLLSGPLSLNANGVPTVSSTWSSDSPGTSTLSSKLQNLQVQLDGHLQGSFEGTTKGPASLLLKAKADRAGPRLAIDIDSLSMRALDAKGQAQGRLERSATGAWQWRGGGEVENFDPKLWWPTLSAAPAWRQGSHRMQGQWRAELQAPSGLRWPSVWTPQSVADLALKLRGQTEAKWDSSRLAGLPLGGNLRWRHLDDSGSILDADVQSQGNALTLQAKWMARSSDDRWSLRVEGREPAVLAPWASLFGTAASTWWPKQGQVQAQVSAQGRWPQAATDGQVELSSLRMGDWQVKKAQSSWNVAPLASLQSAQGPLNIKVSASDVSTLEPTRPGQASTWQTRWHQVNGSVEGTAQQHTFSADASTPARPPAWSHALLGLREATDAARKGVDVSIQGTGRWAVGSTRSWQGTVAKMAVQPRSDAQAPAWLAASDLGLSIGLSPSWQPTEVQLAPGSAKLMGAALRWTQARWQDTGASRPASLDVDATMEPLRIAPFLDRLAPVIGVGGDLSMGGTFKVRTTPERFEVDAVVERRGGDLTLTDQGVTQSMGLSDLRLALSANDGTWNFTQAIAGTNLGVLAGASTVRVPASTRWPAASAPLEGVMTWRVDNLNALSPWLPPGWRLGGNVSAGLSLGGRLSGPEFKGELTGSQLAVRSLLEGVDVREGDFRLTLRGDDARIERMNFKGGEGTLNVTGGATFGQSPALDLRVDLDRFLALSRVDRRILASGQTRLKASTQDWQLDGRLKVDEGLVDLSRRDAPKLEDDVRIVRPEDKEAEDDSSSSSTDTPASRNPLRRGQLNLLVDLGVKLKGRGIDTRLLGQLTLRSPAGRLSVQGSMRAEEGTYTAYSQNLSISRGVINFNGPIDDPRLDIVAERPNMDVRAGVAITGTALSPRVRLFSEPEMSDTEKLSWLMLGRAPEGLGRADTALLQRAALAIWAGEDGDVPSDALLKSIGIDELSLRQTESGDVRETVVRVGKQLGRHWYVGYERGVNSTTGTWQVIYRVAQRFTLRAQSGADNSLDGIWTWRWD